MKPVLCAWRWWGLSALLLAAAAPSTARPSPDSDAESWRPIVATHRVTRYRSDPSSSSGQRVRVPSDTKRIWLYHCLTLYRANNTNRLNCFNSQTDSLGSVSDVKWSKVIKPSHFNGTSQSPNDSHVSPLLHLEERMRRSDPAGSKDEDQELKWLPVSLAPAQKQDDELVDDFLSNSLTDLSIPNENTGTLVKIVSTGDSKWGSNSLDEFVLTHNPKPVQHHKPSTWHKRPTVILVQDTPQEHLPKPPLLYEGHHSTSEPFPKPTYHVPRPSPEPPPSYQYKPSTYKPVHHYPIPGPEPEPSYHYKPSTPVYHYPTPEPEPNYHHRPSTPLHNYPNPESEAELSYHYKPSTPVHHYPTPEPEPNYHHRPSTPLHHYPIPEPEPEPHYPYTSVIIQTSTSFHPDPEPPLSSYHPYPNQEPQDPEPEPEIIVANNDPVPEPESPHDPPYYDEPVRPSPPPIYSVTPGAPGLSHNPVTVSSGQKPPSIVILSSPEDNPVVSQPLDDPLDDPVPPAASGGPGGSGGLIPIIPPIIPGLAGPLGSLAGAGVGTDSDCPSVQMFNVQTITNSAENKNCIINLNAPVNNINDGGQIESPADVPLHDVPDSSTVATTTKKPPSGSMGIFDYLLSFFSSMTIFNPISLSFWSFLFAPVSVLLASGLGVAALVLPWFLPSYWFGRRADNHRHDFVRGRPYRFRESVLRFERNLKSGMDLNSFMDSIGLL